MLMRLFLAYDVYYLRIVGVFRSCTLKASMSELFRDLRFGGRLLFKSPVFAVTAVLLLAIGISANTLIFSLVDAVLLRPLPVSRPDNLVRLIEIHPNDFHTWDFPYRFCDIVTAQAASLSEVLCQREVDVALTDSGATERVRVHLVSPNFFTSLGVSAFRGRLLTAEDEHQAALNAVLSYDFWQRRYGGDPAVIGRHIALHGHAFTIVGVSPEDFNGLTVDTSPDIRVPIAVNRFVSDTPLFAQIFGRLRAGAGLEDASGEADHQLRAAFAELMHEKWPDTFVLESHLQFEPVGNGVSALRAPFSRGLGILMAAVALLLIMACANVAGLLLARSAGRAQEMSVRLALGAGRGRIVRQLLSEGLLLALLGGGLGMLFTIACLPLLIRALPPIRDRGAVLQPLAVHIDIDPRVLGFTLAVTLLTAVLFALSPALRGARSDIATTLRAGRSTTKRLLGRNLIVVAQVAICTLILLAAALLVETLDHMRNMQPGFDRDHVVTFTVDPELGNYQPEQAKALSKALLEKVRQLPEAVSASLAGKALMRGTGVKATMGAAGKLVTSADFLNCSLNNVTPGYFETMGMKLLAGRDFNWFDRDRTTPHPVIVNQTFASRFFPAANPIGRRFGGAGAGGVAKADSEIVGVVSDAKYRSLREPFQPTVYSAVVDGYDSSFILHVRTRENPVKLIAPVRAALRSLDPELPFVEVRTLREEVEASLWQERLLAELATIFGLIAAVLAGIGLYGALDYAVKSRTREIGVRMALGARPARIVGLFAIQIAPLLVWGIVLGLGAYAVLATWIRRVLYGLDSWEPIAVISVLVLVALLAAISAAPSTYRAVRVDPASALRAE